MRKIEVEAKTVEKATEKGLQMLDTTIENVIVKVLNKGSMLTKAKIELVHFDNVDERKAYEDSFKQTEKPVVAERKNDREKRFNHPVHTAPSAPRKPKEEIPYSKEDNDKASEIAKEYITAFFKTYAEDTEIVVSEQNNDVNIAIKGASAGNLIGYHGECMEAIQTLLNNYVRDKFPTYRRKVYIDIEGYKTRREATLVDMANRLAEKVYTYKRSMKLEPMNAYERRIIHTALAEKEHISTYSEGEEPRRYLVIDYVE